MAMPVFLASRFACSRSAISFCDGCLNATSPVASTSALPPPRRQNRKEERRKVEALQAGRRADAVSNRWLVRLGYCWREATIPPQKQYLCHRQHAEQQSTHTVKLVTWRTDDALDPPPSNEAH